ncbi:hypothetical protein PR001_g20301 [Phytophthora rubi]|uniref:Peptidase A2 domain-containing protein n=1 Tax=Phytophthora rubi TaxID=129364 RepID=A0A6A3JIN5_9STRA|nr:hypothetical protein PR001_g20301 [Phytophthora rubi]
MRKHDLGAQKPINHPVKTLARTRESSPGELSTPEYWLSWYKKTLAATEEARRANRNFQGTEPAGGKTGRVGSVSLTASDGRDVGGGDVIGDELLQAGCDPVPVADEVDESVVRGNILTCMKGTGTAVSTPKTDSDKEDSTETTRVEAVPAQYRRLVRQVVHAMVGDEGQLEAPRCATCKTKREVGRSSRRGLEARVRTKMARLQVAPNDRLTRRILTVARRLYDEHADLIRTKITERKLVCRLCRTPVRRREHTTKRRVRFGCSSLFSQRSEAFPDREPGRPGVDDLYGYVYSVNDGDDARRRRAPGLVEVSDAESDDDAEPSFLRDGKRVIGSVGGVEAVSAGYIDCTPVEMLIDTGAIASLVNSRVLKRVGRADSPLRPSNKDLNGVTGHKLRIRGEIDLPLRVGPLEVMRLFVVVDRLHVDTILGTDTLKELRAVIDLE